MFGAFDVRPQTPPCLHQPQAISDAEGAAGGRTLDKFTLHKPRGWRPAKVAQAEVVPGGAAAAAWAVAAAWLDAASGGATRLWRRIAVAVTV